MKHSGIMPLDLVMSYGGYSVEKPKLECEKDGQS